VIGQQPEAKPMFIPRWPHLWERVPGGYICQSWLRETQVLTTFGCPGRRGRKVADYRVRGDL
jgi:hypothetical protein